MEDLINLELRTSALEALDFDSLRRRLVWLRPSSDNLGKV